MDNTTRLQSITQERDLDEFLNTAQLAGTQFTAGIGDLSFSAIVAFSFFFCAERRNVKIVTAVGTQANPYLLSDEEERKTLQRHRENKQRLRVPRRPPWTKAMTTAQLDRQEKDAFLEWRRGIAQYGERSICLRIPLIPSF